MEPRPRLWRQSLLDERGGAALLWLALIAVRERWHRGGGQAGSIRAAILGRNDGLVSSSLVTAGAVVAGGILVTGLAGLLAGVGALKSSGRMVGLALFAGGPTFGVGKLPGVAESRAGP